jgi:adenylate kinase
MERDIILIGGMPGSGKSRLGKSLANELRTEMSIEHLSTGDLVRAIGRGAIQSHFSKQIHKHLTGPNSQQLLPNEIIYTVIDEALTAHSSTEHLLVDGYPRTIDQFDDLTEIARYDDRKTSGAIITATSDDMAVLRMIKRSPRDYEGSLTVDQARQRIALHNDNYSPVLRAFNTEGLPVKMIDTSGIKADTNRMGVEAVRTILGATNFDEHHAA